MTTGGERIGLLGVGRMGRPIAGALVEAGFDVLVHDPVAARTEGLTAARSVAEVAAYAGILVTVLPGTPELKAAMALALPALRPASLWLDLTSCEPRVVERLARGIDAVGAPMGGGPSAAESHTLKFSVGGRSVDRARPVLEALGTVDHIGESITAGYTAKLLANLLWFGQVVAVTEALLLGQALGVSPATLRRTLASSAGGSVFIDEYLDRLLDGDYLATFGLDRCVEELDSLAALALTEGVPFELSNTVARLHREALARFGAVDGELLAAKLLEERAGRDLRA
jgi:3-hydroxyisobutyrate dehydrogenase